MSPSLGQWCEGSGKEYYLGVWCSCIFQKSSAMKECIFLSAVYNISFNIACRPPGSKYTGRVSNAT
jgi:hypothetical protein